MPPENDPRESRTWEPYEPGPGTPEREVRARRRDFDYSPLTERAGLGARLRAVWSNNLWVYSVTLGALMVAIPLIIFVSLLATGNLTDWGGVAVMAMVFGSGVYVLVSIVWKAGEGSALGSFARTNELEQVSASTKPHYAGSHFAAGSHTVLRGVRTRDEAFVEVGDRFPVTNPRVSYNPNRPGGGVRAESRKPELYLRARLSGRADREPQDGELVTPDLHEALTGFAGAYTVEVSGDELTLFGSRELDVDTAGRVEEAFALADALASRADQALVQSPTPGAETRAEPAPARTRSPLAVIGLTLAVLIGVPIVFAIVMSIIEGPLRGNRAAAGVVVALFLAVTAALVGFVVRKIMAPRRAAEDSAENGGRRWGRWGIAAVVLVVIVGVAAWAISGEDDPYADTATAADCATDDLMCQREVSLRNWAAEHGLTRVESLDEESCQSRGPQRWVCAFRAECENNSGIAARLDALFEGDPQAVVGVAKREARPKRGRNMESRDVERLVARRCDPTP